MLNYVKRKVVNQNNVTDGSLACVNCGNSYYMAPNTEGHLGFTIVRVTNIDDSDNQQDGDGYQHTHDNSINKLYIHAVCNHCSQLNVFIYKLKGKSGSSWYKLSDVWLEVADSE